MYRVKIEKIAKKIAKLEKKGRSGEAEIKTLNEIKNKLICLKDKQEKLTQENKEITIAIFNELANMNVQEKINYLKTICQDPQIKSLLLRNPLYVDILKELKSYIL